MDDQQLAPYHIQLINERAPLLKNILARYDSCNYGNHLKDLELANYIEDLINVVVGPSQVMAYLKDLVQILS
jgi:hypothetical protein